MADIQEGIARGNKNPSDSDVAAVEQELIELAIKDASIPDPRYEDGAALVVARQKLSAIHDRLEHLQRLILTEGDHRGLRAASLAGLREQDRHLTGVIRHLEAE